MTGKSASLLHTCTLAALLVLSVADIQTKIHVIEKGNNNPTWQLADAVDFVTSTLDTLWLEACIFSFACLGYLISKNSPATLLRRSSKAKATSETRVVKPSEKVSSARAVSSEGSPKTANDTPVGQIGLITKSAKTIIAAGKDGDLSSAIRAFQKARASEPNALNSLIFNCIMDACVQCKNLHAALEYFAEAKMSGLADVVGYNTIMKGYLAEGDSETVRELLLEMQSHGLQPTYVAYHCLLNALVARGSKAKIWAVIRQMTLAGLSPNAVTCSILFKTIASTSPYSELQRLLQMMDSLDQSSDEVLYASMVEACIRIGRLDVLSGRTKSMAQQGLLTNLSAPIYGSMIKAYGQAQDTDRIWELWEEMRSRNVVPTSITLGCVVEALVVNKQVDSAWHVVQEVWEDPLKRPAINTIVYSTLLKGFAMSKQYKRVAALYEEMVSRGVPRNTITYNTMLNAVARCGLVHRVPAILADMRGAQVEPDTVTYSTIVKAYSSSGELDKAFQVLRVMKRESQLVPDEVTYNSLLDGCAKQRRLDDALWVLEEMRASRVKPSNYTLSIILKLLGRARKLDSAFEMVGSMTREYQFSANIQVYTCLIQACFHNRQVQRALDLHDQIVRDGYTLDQKIYTVLARGCVHCGALSKAEEVVRCAFHWPGHSLMQTPGQAEGLDASCLQELLPALGPESSVYQLLHNEMQLAVR